MVRRIKRRKPRKPPHKKPGTLREAAVLCLKLSVGQAASFSDGSQIQHDVDGFHVWPEGIHCQASAVLPHLHSLEVEAALRVVPEEVLMAGLRGRAPEPEPEHVPDSSDNSGRFPIFTYSRLAAEDVEDGEEAGEDAGEGSGESIEPSSDDIQMWTPNLDTVKALHLCGTFMVWELEEKLVLDDDGSNSAVHVFTSKSLALDVMRGRTRRRGLHAREGYVGSVKHSGDWRERVARLLG